MIEVAVRPWQRWRRHGWALLAVLVVGALVWGPGARHVRAAALLLRFEGVEGGVAGWFASRGAREVRTSKQQLDTAAGPVRARRYEPVGESDAPGLVLVHGVHHAGMDEPRLLAFAKVLASAGIDVLTPQVPSLADLRIQPGAVRVIGATASAFASELGRRQVGVMGISFAGGLALLAAADPELGRRIGYVVAVGAHDDLVRVTQWYAGQLVTGPDGEAPPVAPHPYGAAVIVDNHLEAFFAAEDLPVAREALDLYLHDRWKAARAERPELSEAGQRRLDELMGEGDRRALDARLLEVVNRDRAAFEAVSPAGRLGQLHVPVLLIAGRDDPVVPSTETRWLAREVPNAYLEDVLVTPALRHAEEKRPPTFQERWQLTHFVAHLLALANE